MKELFVPYDIALALKELGFDEPCLAWFEQDVSYGPESGFKTPIWRRVYMQIDGNEDEILIVERKEIKKEIVDFGAPLFDQVVEWLIEKHGIYITPQLWRVSLWECEITTPTQIFHLESLKSRKYALIAGINTAINLIKEKSDENVIIYNR